MLSEILSRLFAPVMPTLVSPAEISATEAPVLRVQVRVQALPACAVGGTRFHLRFEIYNASSNPVRLLSRRWRLIDADHHQVELLGQCVSGQRPEIFPGASYRFTSEVQLTTAWGSLEGSFRALDADGGLIEIELERQMLVTPRVPELV
jgi:ApaG protein